MNSPWMYLFTHQAYITQEIVNEIRKQLWNASPRGYPDKMIWELCHPGMFSRLLEYIPSIQAELEQAPPSYSYR